MAECNPVYMTGARAELSLNQPDTMLLGSTGIQLYEAITGFLMFLSQWTRYDITYAVNPLARAMSKQFELHMTGSEHLLRYLNGDMGLAITYQDRVFRNYGVLRWEPGKQP